MTDHPTKSSEIMIICGCDGDDDEVDDDEECNKTTAERTRQNGILFLCLQQPRSHKIYLLRSERINKNWILQLTRSVSYCFLVFQMEKCTNLINIHLFTGMCM